MLAVKNSSVKLGLNFMLEFLSTFAKVLLRKKYLGKISNQVNDQKIRFKIPVITFIIR